MARKRKSDYIPIQIEALQPNGEWWVRNAFTSHNSEVRAGIRMREWLIAHATSLMTGWGIGIIDDRPLRVSGIPERVVVTYTEDGRES